MLKKLLAVIWRNAPRIIRRWCVWLVEPRFAITAGAVVLNKERHVLLLKHVFRKGSGWGIPGGFLEKGEQPEEAVRRELREEAGVEIDRAEIVLVRTLKRPQQLEIIFRCRAREETAAHSQNFEIKSAEWFAPNALPQELGIDQRRTIERALNTSANMPG